MRLDDTFFGRREKNFDEFMRRTLKHLNYIRVEAVFVAVAEILGGVRNLTCIMLNGEPVTAGEQ